MRFKAALVAKQQRAKAIVASNRRGHDMATCTADMIVVRTLQPEQHRKVMAFPWQPVPEKVVLALRYGWISHRNIDFAGYTDFPTLFSLIRRVYEDGIT